MHFATIRDVLIVPFFNSMFMVDKPLQNTYEPQPDLNKPYQEASTLSTPLCVYAT